MQVGIYDSEENELWVGAWVVFVGEDKDGSAWDVDAVFPDNMVRIWDHVTDGWLMVDARELILCEGQG